MSSLEPTDPEAAAWDTTVDVIVVGFGAAGAAAALEAHERGASVLLVDRFEGGGATAYSGGIYYAGNTRHQEAAGYDDPPDQMFAYLSQEIGDAVTSETLRRFCEDSRANLEWLERLGVPFEGSLFEGKSTYPSKDKYLYYSGNEKLERFARHAKPAPRGHRIVGKGWTGKDFFAALKRAAERARIQRFEHTRATRLIVDANGRVIGLEARQLAPPCAAAHQSLYRKVDPFRPLSFERSNRAIAASEALEANASAPRRLRARRGVILATGGFAYNLSMLKRHLPRYAESADCLLRLGSAACNGDGLTLAQEAGADLGKMHRLFAGRSITPPFELLKGIVVNAQGKRFVNEDAYNATLGEAIANQSDSRAWLVLDGRSFWAAFRGLLPRGDGNFMVWYLPTLLNVLFGGTRRASTPAELAAKCGIDARALGETLGAYNADARAGRADPMGKLAEYVAPIEGSSYWAVNLAMKSRVSFMMFFTLGGIRVDERTGEALRPDGSRIAGLYAAGRAAVGICANTYACSGLSLADGVFSGRRAGRHAATGEGAGADSLSPDQEPATVP